MCVHISSASSGDVKFCARNLHQQVHVRIRMPRMNATDSRTAGQPNISSVEELFFAFANAYVVCTVCRVYANCVRTCKCKRFRREQQYSANALATQSVQQANMLAIAIAQRHIVRPTFACELFVCANGEVSSHFSTCVQRMATYSFSCCRVDHKRRTSTAEQQQQQQHMS